MKALITLTIVLLCTKVFSNQYGLTVGNLVYSYPDDAGNTSVIGYTGTPVDVTVPSSVTLEYSTYEYDDEGGTNVVRQVRRNCRVNKINHLAFFCCDSIESVIISDGIEQIGSSAFVGCDSLLRILIPKSVNRIEGSALSCRNLSRIDITDLAAWCNLDDQYPSFLPYISYELYLNGKIVRNLVIPEGVEKVGYDAFRGCSSLINITIPTSVRRIDYGALCCENLQDIVVSSGNHNFASCDGVLFSKDFSELIQYPAGKSDNGYAIPYGVEQIGSGAFRGCSNLHYVVVPDSVRYIGDYAFCGCILYGIDLPFTDVGYSAFAGSICGSISILGGSVAPYAFDHCMIDCVWLGVCDIAENAFCGVQSPWEDSCEFELSFVPFYYSVSEDAFPIGAKGFYGRYDETEWRSVIDANGYWHGLKMFPNWVTIKYESNSDIEDVEGEMRNDYPRHGGEYVRLSTNVFKKKGCLFQGWATSVENALNGIVSYTDNQYVYVDSDMTLYAVWATFEPVAANWGTGSITLKATGVNLKEGEDFFLSFCDAATADSDGAQWEYVDDFGKTVDGNSVSVTDSQYSSRLGGIPAVRYRLQIGKSKDDVRAELYCTTRTRFGLSIGLGSYDSKVYKLYAPEDLSICRNNAELANEVMVQKGGGILAANMVLLTDHTANKATVENISHEWKELAQEKTKPGDVIFSFIATHGAASGAVLAYDDLYTIGKFQRDIEPFRTGSQIGVKVVILLLNCHSEAMTSAERDINFEYGSLCTPNIIYVAVADAKESEWSLHRDDDSSFYARTYSAGGEFFINQGMNKHRADNLKTLHGVEGVFGNRDGRIDLLECTEYMKALAIGNSDQNPTHVQYDSLKSDIMKDTIIVSSDTFSDVSIPQAPRITDVSEKFFSTTIKVQWEEVSNAQYYKVFYSKAGESTEHWIACNGGLTELEIKTADIATADDREDYAPLDNDTSYEFSMVAVNAGGHSLRSNAYTKKTSIASRGTVYKVSLFANGGSVSPTFKNVEKGHIVGSLPTPTRNGRTFLGWFTDAVDGVEIGEHSIVSKDIKCYAHWSKPSTVINLPTEWLRCYPSFAMQASDNPLEASELISANGCRTLGECYALGIDPEDPNDDLKITDFKIEDGKPVITLNHTKDGSGNSFEPRIKTLGKANLTDPDWIDITGKDHSAYRFFKATVDLP